MTEGRLLRRLSSFLLDSRTIAVILQIAFVIAVIAAVITKFATAPLAPYLGGGAAYSEETLIGRSCVVSSGEATPTFGQAKYNTGGAPLLLNIRTDGPHLAKGTPVRIVSFDPSKRIYSVTLDTDTDLNTFSGTQT